MGRGNVCVNKENEGLYYVDYNNFRPWLEEENYEIDEYQLDDFKEEFIIEIKKRFKSFIDINEFENNKEILLRNNLFSIAIEDNEWSLAVELLETEDYYDSPNLDGLRYKHSNNYLNGIKETLLDMFGEIGIRTSAWTSGTIKK